MRRWLTARPVRVLLAICLISVLAGCAPKTIIIPDSHKLEYLGDGHYKISAGYLREIYQKCGIEEE